MTAVGNIQIVCYNLRYFTYEHA